MQPSWTGVLILSLFSVSFLNAQSVPAWHAKRQSPSDLELGGALTGVLPESIRYLTREELLAMPQVNFTVTDDPNFTGPAKIRGVELEVLAKRLAASPASDMVVAICDDAYRAGYPRDYLATHHPVLVLEVNGKPPAGWPKDLQEHKWDMGPYMISNPQFAPSFKILSHEDEAQIPWGVVRIDFRDEKTVLGAIAPRGPQASNPAVKDGYRIAAQNCFRCHNMGGEGGQKSGIAWTAIAAMAARAPSDFAAYVREPQAKNPKAQMPGNPQYDDATLDALTEYFRTFAASTKP